MRPGERGQRQETEQFRPFGLEELLARDKVNLDIFWLKDETLEDSASLPTPDVLAQEIAEKHDGGLNRQFCSPFSPAVAIFPEL